MFVQGAWHPEICQKLLIYSVCYFNLKGLKFCLGGLARKSPPVATGLTITRGKEQIRACVSRYYQSA